MLGDKKKLVLGLIQALNCDSLILEGFCDITTSFTGDLAPTDDADGYYVVTALVSDADITSKATLPIVRQIGFIPGFEDMGDLSRYVDCPNKDGWYTIKEEYCDGYTPELAYCFDLDETINDGIYIYTREQVAKHHTIVDGHDSLYVISELPNSAFQKLQYVAQSPLVEFTNYLPQLGSVYGKIDGFVVYMHTYYIQSGLKANYYCVSYDALALMRKEKHDVSTSTRL